MPFARPTLPELITRVKNDLAGRVEGDPFLARSFEAIFATVSAGVTHGLHGHLSWVARQVIPSSDSDDESVLSWANLFLDPPRKKATKASGDATFTGTNATVIPAGTEVQLTDRTLYTTDADGTISSGSVTVSVTAVEPGEDGNADAGAKISLVSPIAGVDTDGTVAAGGLDGGTDDEDIASVLTRLQGRLANPPRGGGEGDFVAWALETPGVSVDKAWEFPKRNGAGTVGLSFTVVGGPIPSAGDVTSVDDYVASKAPTFLRSIDVFAPTPVNLTMDIQLQPNTTAVQNAVLAELEDLVDREAVPEQPILLSHLDEAISNAEGEEDHLIVSPTADVTTATGELIVFNVGSITFSSL